MTALCRLLLLYYTNLAIEACDEKVYTFYRAFEKVLPVRRQWSPEPAVLTTGSTSQKAYGYTIEYSLNTFKIIAMKEILRLDRPSLEKITADRLNVFLQDLLTMNVNDAVGIALDAYIRWARVLKPEEIDEWIQPHLKKCKADYERLVFSNRRRFIMIIVLGDFLGNASLDRSHPRSALAGWREINKDEAEQLVQRIHLWLANLAINEAFDSITELILRWADQYNAQMAIEFAQSCGQIDADQYSDENITIFLRWCFQDDLELADAQLTWHNWAD